MKSFVPGFIIASQGKPAVAARSGMVLNVSAYHAQVFSGTDFAEVFFTAWMFICTGIFLPSVNSAYRHGIHST